MDDEKGILEDHSGGYRLTFARFLAHPPEKVWRALTENDELTSWFPARIEGPREAGASLRFVFPPEPGQPPSETEEEGVTMTGTMLVFDPPRLLEYTWDTEVLRWVLEPRAGGTLLTFTHTFDDQARAARDASGWDFCFASLGSHLAGLPVEPFTTERFETLFAEYARRFGPAAAQRKTPDM